MLKSLFFASAALFFLGGCGENPAETTNSKQTTVVEDSNAEVYVIDNRTANNNDIVALIHEGLDKKIILESGRCVTLSAEHFKTLRVELDHGDWLGANDTVCKEDKRCSPSNYEIVDTGEVLFDNYQWNVVGSSDKSGTGACESFTSKLAGV